MAASSPEAFLTSIIVTTFNWPLALGAVLRSILRQSVQDLEVIVADDGSATSGASADGSAGGSIDTAKIVDEVLGPCSLRWCHVWHPDSGIRQARIKNLAVKYSTGQYLIFIDHDVLLHPRFVEDHLAMAKEGFFLQGKRVFLSDLQTSAHLCSKTNQPLNQLAGQSAQSNGSVSILPAGVGNRQNGLRIPWLGRLMARPGRFQRSLRGCNLSMHRKDFMQVDGYDETFDQLWGREDSDICYRLFHNGVKVRNLWFQALQYHLAHKTIKKCGTDRLDEELDRIVLERRGKALKGFSQISSEGGVVAAAEGYER